MHMGAQPTPRGAKLLARYILVYAKSRARCAETFLVQLSIYTIFRGAADSIWADCTSTTRICVY